MFTAMDSTGTAPFTAGIATREIEISEIRVERDLYPREESSKGDIEAYRLALDKLPEIEVNKNLILIDGYHRLQAHRFEGHEKVRVIINDIPDNQVLIEAIKRNAKHGKRLEISDKKALARKLYGELNLNELAKLLSISERSIRGWTRQQREKEKTERSKKIETMSNGGLTQREIADKLNIDHATVSRTLDNLVQNGSTSKMHQITNLDQNSTGGKMAKNEEVTMTTIFDDNEQAKLVLKFWLGCYTAQEMADILTMPLNEVLELIEEIQKTFNSSIFPMQTPEPLKYIDVWNFSGCNKEYGYRYPGRIPGQIVEHILYYYTKPGDIVIDPFAGSGTTVDVCKHMMRRYQAYDIKPVRDDIRRHDITIGFPDRAKSCELIFLDPPYWNMRDREYPEGSVSSLSLEGFRAFVKRLARDCFDTVKQGGHVAYLIQNQAGNSAPENMACIDHIGDGRNAFLSAGFKFIREINVPLTIETLTPQHVEKAKRKRSMMGLVRDLVVWKK